MSATAEHQDVFVAVGRRKNATARVRLTRGEGKATVNGRDAEIYLYDENLMRLAFAPLETAELTKDVNLLIKVTGGGPVGQAGAIAHGIARAVEKMNPDLRVPLKKAGHLTRDPRMKERKKSGQPGARKRFQFSKR